MSAIARRFEVPVRVLADANEIHDADYVRAGRRLEIPGAPTPSAPAVVLLVAQPPSGTTAGRGLAHRVRQGETLSAISRRYRVDASTVAELNGIRDPDVLRSGVTLRLPVEAREPREPPLCPVRGATKLDVARNFGAPRLGGPHAGNDIFGARGTAVVASSDGVLRRADGRRAGKAYYIERSDGVVFYGAHLGSITARSGPVSRGEVIGTVGNTGNAHSTPPHLHFEVHAAGEGAIDPYALLRSWCR